ncbi:hypothetical protein QYE76_031447 [Lolium multiflorum]|uniref:Reverse transcriptase zinc-binding domain-containing protein n=1 Tax=Lolium multiflorum TaxID=4521 RepID=A0AAD8VIH0_LOLMU|nr:hypothetical protein QYE76_031447 [Lolium multiflorum]
MATTAACSICGQEDSWRHSLFECNLARCVWALTDEDIIEHVAPASEPHARKWLFSVIETMKKTGLIWMLVTMWAIWHAKRKAGHEEVYQSPIATVTFVSRFFEDIGEVKNTGDRVQPKEPKQRRGVFVRRLVRPPLPPLPGSSDDEDDTPALHLTSEDYVHDVAEEATVIQQITVISEAEAHARREEQENVRRVMAYQAAQAEARVRRVKLEVVALDEE